MFAPRVQFSTGRFHGVAALFVVIKSVNTIKFRHIPICHNECFSVMSWDPTHSQFHF